MNHYRIITNLATVELWGSIDRLIATVERIKLNGFAIRRILVD